MDAGTVLPGRSVLVRVAVAGDSMLPTLRAGDWLICRRLHHGDEARPGEVVLLERPDRPGLLVVKRAVRRDHDGWWVEGDNAARSDDSRVFGAVPPEHLLALVLARYHPRPRLV